MEPMLRVDPSYCLCLVFRRACRRASAPGQHDLVAPRPPRRPPDGVGGHAGLGRTIRRRRYSAAGRHSAAAAASSGCAPRPIPPSVTFITGAQAFGRNTCCRAISHARRDSRLNGPIECWGRSCDGYPAARRLAHGGAAANPRRTGNRPGFGQLCPAVSGTIGASQDLPGAVASSWRRRHGDHPYHRIRRRHDHRRPPPG